MDIRGSSAVTYTPPAASGRSGSSESSAEIRKTASDSAQERKEAEQAGALRQLAQNQSAEHKTEHRDVHRAVDIRV